MNEITKKNQDVYRDLYTNSLEKYSFEVLSKTFIFKKLINDADFQIADKSILEIGFGSGNLIPFLLDRGANYHGLEISESAINQCKLKFSAIKVGFIKDKIPYPSDMFDYIIMSHSLEHIEDESFMLQECKRVLKQGGNLIIGVPSLDCPDNTLHFRVYSDNDSERISNTHELQLVTSVGLKGVGWIEKLLSYIVPSPKGNLEKTLPKKSKKKKLLFLPYYWIISPFFSYVYSRNYGKKKIREWWYIFKK